MEYPATHQQLMLRLEKTIKIPSLVEPSPGPLHTILQDDEGNIYYTDEINHSVASLNVDGEVRWHRNGRGNKPGEFWYPKGLDLGRVCANGGGSRGCVAVCDSWNHRVQFFRLDGTPICQWGAAAKVPFKEVVDIRFIGAELHSGRGDSCWLVLDRGNHHLYGLDLTGQLLFQIGRPYTESLECRWPVPATYPAEPGRPDVRGGEMPAFDPLFMPLRIFGAAPEALFVWEPKSQRLKQACLGNLLPVWIEPPAGAEWIGADAEGLLVFSQASGFVSSYDPWLRAWRSAPIEGTTIPSGRSSNEIWVQAGNEIRHFSCAQQSRSHACENAGPSVCALSRLAAEIENRLGGAEPLQGIVKLQRATDRLCALGRAAIEPSTMGSTNSDPLEKLRNDLALQQQEFSAVLATMQGFEHILFLSLLKLQSVQAIYAGVEKHERFRQAAACLHASARPVARMFERLLHFRDDCTHAGVGSLSRLDSPESAKSLRILLEDVDAAILQDSIELSKWSWLVSATDEFINTTVSVGQSRSSSRSQSQPWLLIMRPRSYFMKHLHAEVQARPSFGPSVQDPPKAPSHCQCPVCAEGAPLALMKREHPFYQCAVCRAVFTPRIDPSIITTENQDSEGRHDLIKDEIRLMRMSEATARKIIQVLDYGCGNGEYGRHLRNRIECVDVDQHTALQLKDIGDAAMDGINAVEVIEHLCNPVQIFSEFHRILRPGGVVYVESSFVREQDLSTWEYLDPAIGHCLVHSEQSLLLLAERTNFRLRKYNDNVFLLIKPADVGDVPQ